MTDGKRGGPRPGSGGLVRKVTLSEEDARTLRVILLARYGKANKGMVEAFFAGIIREQWTAYDAMIQEATEALDGLA